MVTVLSTTARSLRSAAAEEGAQPERPQEQVPVCVRFTDGLPVADTLTTRSCLPTSGAPRHTRCHWHKVP